MWLTSGPRLEDFHLTFVIPLNTFKGLGKVWHKSLLYKHPSFVFSSSLFPVVYLSLWSFHCKSGVPLSSVLLPFLFLLSVNDFSSTSNHFCSLAYNSTICSSTHFPSSYFPDTHSFSHTEHIPLINSERVKFLHIHNSSSVTCFPSVQFQNIIIQPCNNKHGGITTSSTFS